MKTKRSLSDADARRDTVIDAAIKVFSKSGYASTPVTAVAAEAGISQAYVFKLFPAKEDLFVAAIDRCYARIETTLGTTADAAGGKTPVLVLDAMSEGYARLIADRTVMMLQVHAQAASDIEAIRIAVQAGLGRVVRFAKRRSGADDAAIQSFIAFGQLCHLVVATGLTELDDDWAKSLWAGLYHFEPQQT